MMETIIAILVLMVISAFFSGSETALTAASEPLLHQLENKGNSRARAVNRLRAHQATLIGTILIGNNLVNILASALATSLLIASFGERGIVFATVAMTALIVIFAEILPKTYALHNSSRVALLIAPAMRPVVWLLGPLSRALQWIVNGTLRLLGAGPHRDDAFVHPDDEIRGAIALHQGGEEAVDHERAMLRSVLDLAEVDVGEIVVHRKDVEAIDLGEKPETIIDTVLESRFTRLPVWRDERDNVVGVLHAKALLRAIGKEAKTLTVAEIEALTTEPWFVPETTSLLDQLHAFRERAEHFALVVDEYGSLLGVVTLEDILEEIVGDITDEHDLRVPGIRPQPDGSLTVNGKVTIRDLNRQFDWALPDEEAATLAGLILHESRRIPETGQVFRFYGFRFEIMRRQRNQITLIRISPPEPSTDDARETAAED